MEANTLTPAEILAHWRHVAPLLEKPRTEAGYDRLVSMLNSLLDLVGEDETLSVNRLIEHIGDAVAAYDDKHYPPPPDASGAEMLRSLMLDHDLRQSDVPELGAQSVVSAVLSGKRRMSAEQAIRLGRRFKLDPEAFLNG
ncbi:MAG: transcriptional regulator [Microvirga sp.]